MGKMRGKILAIVTLLVFSGLLIMTIAGSELQDQSKKQVLTLGKSKFMLEKGKIYQYKPKNRETLITMLVIGFGLMTAGIILFGIEWSKFGYKKEGQ